MKITEDKLILEEKLPGTIYFDFNFLKLKDGHSAIVYLREDKNCDTILGIYDLEKREVIREVLALACGKRPYKSILAIDSENRIYLNGENGEMLIYSSDLLLLETYNVELEKYDIDGKEFSLCFVKEEILFAREANKIIILDKRSGQVIDIIKIDKSEYSQFLDNLLIQDIFDFGDDSILLYCSESEHASETSNIKVLLIYNITRRRIDKTLYYLKTTESYTEELYAAYPHFFALNKNTLSVINVLKNEMIKLVFEQSFNAFSMKSRNNNKECFFYILCPDGSDQSKIYSFNLSIINDL